MFQLKNLIFHVLKFGFKRIGRSKKIIFSIFSNNNNFIPYLFTKAVAREIKNYTSCHYFIIS